MLGASHTAVILEKLEADTCRYWRWSYGLRKPHIRPGQAEEARRGLLGIATNGASKRVRSAAILAVVDLKLQFNA